MANNSYAFTESAIFCQHASLALLGATVLPLAVICFLNSSYEFIITTCSSWVTYTARVRSVRSIASRWMTLGYALFMWTRIETKAENLAWQIYFKRASWNRLTLIASFVFSNPGFPKKARICSASFVVHPPGPSRVQRTLWRHFASGQIFRHLGLCPKPSKTFTPHKFCPIISKLGRYVHQTMPHKSYRTDFSNSKPFGRNSQSNSTTKPPNRKYANFSAALWHIITKLGT